MHPLEELYTGTRDRKVALISRMLKGDYCAAEDVVHDAFTLAWGAYDTYNPDKGKLETWFNAIMFNCLRRHQNKARGHVDGSNDINVEDVLSAIPENKKASDLLKQIKKVGNDRHRDILMLFFEKGYTSSEISLLYDDITQTNVTTIVNRFKERMNE